jgi:hypothetical protein
VRTLRQLLKQPEENADLATAEVAVEHMIDPSINEKTVMEQLDAWAAKVRARFPQGGATSNDAKFTVLISTLYEPGPWNDFHPFSYDLDDPEGLNISNKLMSRYLASRKGNCVSMPELLVILGQKLGIPLTLAYAPRHTLAKYRRDDGEWVNFEATSHGPKADSSYVRELGITPKAVASGIYLRPLSRREARLTPVNVLAMFYQMTRPPEQVLPLAELGLEVDPNDIGSLLTKSFAYHRIIEERYAKHYPTPADIPMSLREGYLDINRNQAALVQNILGLGFVQETDEQRAAYLQTVEHAKAEQQGVVQ